MHTNDPAPPLHLADTPEPAFIRRLLIALTIAVLAVAVVANGAAYIGGVAFARNVMQLGDTTAYVFGGVIELSLAVVAAATFIEAYRMQPTALFRTATWALSGVSGVFGSLFEVMEYLAGHLTLPAALAAAGWRLFAPFLAAGLWELVIHLFCGGRHRAHRAAERRHGLLYAFFKAGETEGLANGTWLAPIAAQRARAAARRIAKHVPQAERDAHLTAWLDSARYGEHVRVSVATIAARTAHRMHADLVHTAADVQDAPAPAPAPAPRRARAVVQAPVHVQTVQTASSTDPAPASASADVQVTDVQTDGVQDAAYAARVADAVQRETDAIRTDLHTPSARTSTAHVRPSIEQRRQVVRDFLQSNRSASGTAVHQALLAAGHDVKLRTAYNDRDAVLAAMS